MIVAYSLVIQAVSVGILAYCFTLFSLAWLQEFDVSRRAVMTTIACLQVGMGVASPLVGRAMDRFAMHHIIAGGVGLMALGLWLAQQATALWQVWLVYATLMPFSSAMMGTLAAQTLVTRWFTHQRGLALGLSATGTNLGGMIFPLLVGGWLPLLGWRQTFLWLALLSLVLVVPLTWVLLRAPRAAKAARPASGNTAVNAAADSGVQWTTRQILTTSMFWLPFLALVPLNMSFSALQFNLASFVRDAGLPDDLSPLLVILGSLCMLLGKVFFGSMGDRMDHRALFWIANATMAAAVAIMMVANTQMLLVFGVLLLGLAGGGILPLMGVIFSSRFGAVSFGRVMGFVMLTGTLAALAPVGAGWSYDVWGSYSPALGVLLFAMLPAGVAMLRLPQPLTP